MSVSERQRQTLFGPLFGPLFALLLAVALVSGCAVAPPRSAIDHTLPPELAPREWAGRFSLSSQSNAVAGRHDAAVGRFLLTSVPASGGRTLDLMLQSPFGQTLANARRLPDGTASLTLADGRIMTASSLDALLAQAIGWPLPIERLTDWLDDRFELVIAVGASAGDVKEQVELGRCGGIADIGQHGEGVVREGVDERRGEISGEDSLASLALGA